MAPPPLLPIVSSLVVVVLLLLFAPSPTTSTNSEGEALHALRTRLSDPTNVLQSWDPTLVNPCTWFHVTCNDRNRVIRLDLGNSNISGTLGPELGRLEHLQYLEIPKSFAKLKSLRFLRLNNNKLTGSIPRELASLSNLKVLDLSNNDLCGTIPTDGPFSTFTLQSFENNSRLNGPELQGLVPYDFGC
uniref:Leucine-rich repeat-containing N-terminal plant-type domain-containing protein n=1 Tax=Ananas comosus var. bracteatus TaxID=296719 RepID=A0A6V7Q3V9_ANACO|nr:unnamed protein product [Ananas comosus var. bracteatus]